MEIHNVISDNTLTTLTVNASLFSRSTRGHESTRRLVWEMWKVQGAKKNCVGEPPAEWAEADHCSGARSTERSVDVHGLRLAGWGGGQCVRVLVDLHRVEVESAEGVL